MKTRSTPLRTSVKQVGSQPIFALSPNTTDALDIYARTKRQQRDTTTWFSMCMGAPAAAVFFKGSRDSVVFRLTACDVIAEAYHELRTGIEVEIISPSMVYKVRERANSLLNELPTAQHLPPTAATSDFLSGLQALCVYAPPIFVPTNRSGDPTRRSLTLTLAKKFAKAFSSVPVDYVHYLITIAWPTVSASATRRVLTSEVTETIKRQCEIDRKAESTARTHTHLTLLAASSTRRIISPENADAIENLEEQIGRIKRGLRRFSTDASSLRAMLEIVSDIQDPSLASEFKAVLSTQLKEYVA